MSFYEFVEALARMSEKLNLLLPLPREKPETVLNMTLPEKNSNDHSRKLKGFLMFTYFKTVDPIKELYKNSNDDDYFRMDQCMMSEKDVNFLLKFLVSKVYHHLINKLTAKGFILGAYSNKI